MKLLDLIFKTEHPTKDETENDIITYKKQEKAKDTTQENLTYSNLNYNNINVYSPQNQEEIEKIIINLQKNEASIINMKGYDKANLTRVLDFLNGAIFALNGSINRLTQDLYLISPKTTKIKILKWGIMKTWFKYLLISLLAITFIATDIITKIIFEGKNIVLINNFLTIFSTHNYGAGLGLLSGKTTLLIILTILFLIMFILYDIFCKNKHILYSISFSLILGGAIGNLIDRIMLGYVRDFIYVNISIMPYYFNFADAFLTIGVILFIIELIFKREPKKNDREVKDK